MQRFVNELVGNVGAVELSGIDVVDPGGDRLSKNCQGLAAVARGSQDTGPGSCMAPNPMRRTRCPASEDVSEAMAVNLWGNFSIDSLPGRVVSGAGTSSAYARMNSETYPASVSVRTNRRGSEISDG